MKEFDVTIVGLGPAGGTLANLLAMHDFSILILDREKSFYPLPRAVHFDDEIMRVFQTIGITKEFLKHTIINKGTKFVNSKDKVILDWPRPKKITENGWYPRYRFHQPDLEKKLRKKLKNYKKVSIEQNSEVIKIKNSKNHVDITYLNLNNHKEYLVRSKYVIGCDGANSITRKQMKTKMDNLGFTQKWAVVDLILKKKKNNLPDRTIQYSNPKQPATYCRNVGRRRRWEFAIKKNHSDKKVLSENYIWNFLKPWLNKSEAIIERKTIYTFESAIARKWRKGRVFIAGDAAHLMPPFMGQGMCAGIRDASNLAWKISICCKKVHNERLLDTYQSERSSNVKDYINTAMKMGELLNSIGGSKVSDTVYVEKDGTIKMNSIKPELGKGLGNLHDKNRGKIFPSIKINFNKEFDDLFSCYPILITNNKESEKKLKIRTYSSIDIPEIETILKKFNSNSLIIRPDRFVLASTDKSDLKEFSRFYLNEIFAS